VEPDQAPHDAGSAAPGAPTPPAELAAQLSAFARDVQQQNDLNTTLVGIVQAAVSLIPGCDEGSISVVHARRQIRSQAASGELPRLVDALQEQTGQGPCLDAIYTQQTVQVPDMASEPRWPEFAARAAQAGAGSMLSFQLYVQGDTLGSLNLYGRRAGAFGEESEHTGVLFAAHAAVAFDAARTKSGLTRSVATRQAIGQAQGILMERHRLTADQAFALLIRTSQHANVKLRDLAEQVVVSGDLTPAAPGPNPAAPPPASPSSGT
jgi:transcriptional regulator with GAF, ATPase, and Fis domain